MELIGRLFPGWALKRATARAKLQAIKALYEASRPSRTHPLRGNNLSANSVMGRTDGTLRGIARWLDENHDVAISLFSDLVRWSVGTGLTIEPMVKTTGGDPATDLNRELKAAYADWSIRPEVSQTMSMGDAERLIARSEYRDGEMFVHHVNSPRFPYPTDIPYALELLEADYCPFDLTAPARQGKPRIVQGIGVDEWGRPVEYNLWRQHPGDSGYRLASSLTPSGLKSLRADTVSHVRFTRRLGQLRGVPIIHGVIRRLEDIKDIEDSERVAARVDSDLTLLLRNMPGIGTVNADSDADTGGRPVRELEMASGMMVTLAEGEDAEMHTPSRPNAKLDAFLQRQDRMVAKGSNARYSSVSGDYNGTYSAQRQELVEGFMGYEELRAQLVSQFYIPMWRRFVQAAVLARGMSLRGIERRTLFHADYRGPAMPWIDPAKELDYRVGMVDNRLASRPQMIRDTGGDPDVVDAQIAADTAADSDTDAETETPGEPLRAVAGGAP